MAEVTPANDQAAGQAMPQLVLQKIYVKDVSFEAPNAPQIFQEIGENEQAQPQVQLNLGQRATDLGNDLYEVVLSLTLTCTIGERTVKFAAATGTRLEVALGLETIHPTALEQLNKRLDLDRFDRAARFLGDNGIEMRVFVLLGAPHVPRDDSIDWTVRSVEYAAQRGAAVISVIPVRGGNGELERLQALGEFSPPTLDDLEEVIELCSHIGDSVVTADLWDVDRLAAPECCRALRVDRLREWNVGGRPAPRVLCACDPVVAT